MTERVLIAMCGASPAVISVTLFALLSPGHRLHFQPTRVIVITTTLGRDKLTEELLDPVVSSRRDGRRIPRLQRMAEDLELNAGIPLAKEDVLVPCLDDGTEIEDAHSAEELNAMGDLMFDVMRVHMARPDCTVFVSLSGGRKSMSHMAGQCMSVLARPGDHLVHTVVQPAWLESVESFYYPQRGAPCIECPLPERLGESIAQKDISLELTEEPFLAMRRLLQERLGQEGSKPESFTEWISLLGAHKTLDFTVDIDSGNCFVDSDDAPMKMPGGVRSGFVLAYLVQLACKGKVSHPPSDPETLEILQRWEQHDRRRKDKDFDTTQRFSRVKEFFEVKDPACTKGMLANCSIESVSAYFKVSDAPACSLKDDLIRNEPKPSSSSELPNP